MSKSLKCQVWYKANQVSNKISDQVYKVHDQVFYRVYRKVLNQVYHQVRDKVYDQVRKDNE